jgi:hypothetical protein
MDARTMLMATERSRVFFDIAVGGQKAGRVAFELVSLYKQTLKTAANNFPVR